jgi:hypothetical protein
MTEILKRWWKGAYVPPERMHNSDLVFMTGTYDQHWSSKVAHGVLDFWMKYWQWCIGVMLAVIGLIWKH